MPFGVVADVGAVAGAVGGVASLAGAASSGGSGNSPSAAGWEANAMALTDMMGTSSATTSNPYNVFGTSYGDMNNQAAGLTAQAQQMSQGWNTQQQQLGNQQAALSGQITGAANNYLSSGNQQQYAQAMGGLVPAYYGQGNTDMGVQSALFGQAGQAQQYGTQLMNQAFDPQQALYNQQLQLNDQQTASNAAARGLSMSGVGADLANQSDQNFNTSWQNAQLGREATALGAYDTNNSSIGQLYQGGVAAGQQGLANYGTGASLPYNTAQTIYNNNQTAMNNSQTALTNQYAAQSAAQQAAQQGYSDQTSAFTGQQQALANQVNNFNSGNQWYTNQESALMGYYNGSAPAAQPYAPATAANGYAGLGNYLGSSGFQNTATQAATAAANPGVTYDPTTGYATTGGTGILATPTLSDSYALPTSSIWPTYTSNISDSTADAAGAAGIGLLS